MGTYFKKPQSTVPKTKNLAFELVITHSLPETEEQTLAVRPVYGASVGLCRRKFGPRNNEI